MVRRCRPFLGTLVEVWASGPTTLVVPALDRAYGVIAEIHRIMSFHDHHSDLGKLHAASPGEVHRVHRWTWEVIRRSLELSKETEGAFDVTVGSHLIRWGLRPEVPCGAPGPFGNWQDVELLEPGLIRLKAPVRIDLGGIAKGFAVDRALDVLQEAGLASGGVNAGGDLRVFGPAPVPVQVRHPLSRSQCCFTETLTNAALASSSSVETLIRQEDRWIHHGIDPRSGCPAAPHLGVTVRARECWIADALTKVILVDAQAGARLLERYEAEAWVVSADLP